MLRWRQDQRGLSLPVGRVSEGWYQMPREPAVRIDVHEEVLNPDACEIVTQQLAQGRRTFGFTLPRFPTKMELAPFDPGKGIRGEPLLRAGGGLVELPNEGLYCGRTLWWEAQRVDGRCAGLLPRGFVIAEMPKRDMPPTIGHKHIPTAQGIFQREGERNLPGPPPAAVAGRHTAAPRRWHKGRLHVQRQLLDLPAVELTEEGETAEQALTARLCRKGEVDEGAKVSAKIRLVSRDRKSSEQSYVFQSRYHEMKA